MFRAIINFHFNVLKICKESSVLRRFLMVLFGSALVNPAFGQSTVEPPKVSVVDRNHVNMISGTPNITLTPIQFGPKEMGLHHTIANYDGYFHGYADNFMGSVHERLLNPHPITRGSKTVMRVVSGHATTDFDIEGNKFVPIKNPQSSLTRQSYGYLFTDPDGTQYRYEFRTVADVAYLTRISYANGYVITKHFGSDVGGVTTNTGLQFKYIFGTNSYQDMPTEVMAINNAVEYCAPDRIPCNLEFEWPTVQYKWPGGMPQTMYRSPSVFRVISPDGRMAEYFHKPFDVYEGGDSRYQGRTFIPRIVEVRDNISENSPTHITYDYENIVGWAGGGQFQYKTTLEDAVLKTANVNGQEWKYSISNQNYMNQWGTQLMKTATGYQAIKRVYLDAVRGIPTYVEAHDRTFTLSGALSNNVTAMAFPEGNKTTYGYDDRSRLIRVTEVPKAGSDLSNSVTNIGYPTGCPNPKTCNKPAWVEDAKGNRTDYTYHEASGQVATVTLPADANGIRPQRRYTYKQLYAWYKNASGSYQRGSSPIWMLTHERYCRTTATSTSGCTGGADDEVITEYDYGPQRGPNNLFLRGEYVTAEGETRRTCYEYDRYGNRIGETRPKANITRCP
jgi:YD repeat-containing protein